MLSLEQLGGWLYLWLSGKGRDCADSRLILGYAPVIKNMLQLRIFEKENLKSSKR